MHDFFEILGVPSSARAVEVRRLCAGYVRRWHPDFDTAVDRIAREPQSHALLRDVAIDFVDMSAVVDRMQSGFFGRPPRL